MQTILTISCLIMGFIWSAASCLAQHDWQEPKPLMPLTDVQKIIGQIKTKEPSRRLHLLWVWGYDKDHAPGAHDYERVRDLFCELFKSVPKVTVEAVYEFPTQEQFENADLAVFYLHLPKLSDAQYQAWQKFIERGGGVVALHETAIMRPASEGKKLAQCLGMAWEEGRSEWGAVFEDVTIQPQHEIFRGFPEKIRIMDEFYWNLQRSEGIDVLGSARTGPPHDSKGPIPAAKLSAEASPVFWTLKQGKGRVFGTTLGHNTFSYYDPELRIILFRAMAWTMQETPDPFMPLVTAGITSEQGLVGTTQNMRDWKGKRRGPPESISKKPPGK